MSLELESAFDAKRSFTVSSLPARTASESGDFPEMFCAFTFAPFSMSLITAFGASQRTA